MFSTLFHHQKWNIFKCVFICSYLKAVVIISALTLDSSESNVTLLNTYRTKRFTFKGAALKQKTRLWSPFIIKITVFYSENETKYSFSISSLLESLPLTWLYLHTCVCPLWNRAEPCSGLKRSTSQEMFLKAVNSLPSHLQH